MRLPRGSIRSRVISLLAVPLVVLLALWTFAVVTATGPVADLHRFGAYRGGVALPAEEVVLALQGERRTTLAWLAGGRSDTAGLGAARRRGDQAVAAYRDRSGAADLRSTAGALTRQRMREMDQALATLADLRSRVDRGALDRTAALAAYTAVVDAAYRLLLPLAEPGDPTLARQARTWVDLGRAREALSQEDALFAGDTAAGRISDTDRIRLVQAIGLQRFLFSQVAAQLPRAEDREYRALVAGQDFRRLRQVEDAVLAAAPGGGGAPVDAATWTAIHGHVSAGLRALERRAADATALRTDRAADATVWRLVLVGLLGLLVIALSVLISYRAARGLLRRIRGLRDEAAELAEVRLPDAVGRLRRGEPVDLGPAPPAPAGDELDELAAAFAAVRHTALSSAGHDAATRQGLNQAFLNIARRSQTLLHRQLSMLDDLQRRISEPDDLEALFRIDHLATRMRRHANDLVILAGAGTGRGWRRPVPLVDVVRGAVGEVEQYQRVGMRALPEVALAGRVVADVIHLLAELIENAASFSPPNTRVEVSAEVVATGLAVQIEDRGLGMPEADLQRANRRLADPPEFDPADSARLGLYVVSLLAERHSVRVSLRPSPYGGLTAVVLLPAALMVDRPAAPPPVDERVAPVLEIGTAADVRRGRVIPRPRAALEAGAAPGAGRQGARALPVSPVPAADPAGAQPADPAPAGPGGLPARDPGGASPGGLPSRTPGPVDLPRRRQQASLPAQLRADRAPVPEAPAMSRTPDELRAMMAAFQSGTSRGRRDAEQEPPQPPVGPVTHRSTAQPGPREDVRPGGEGPTASAPADAERKK